MLLTIIRYTLHVIGPVAVIAGFMTNDRMLQGDNSYLLSVWMPFGLTTIGIICFYAAYTMKGNN